MSTWYRVNSYLFDRVEVEKETAKFMFIKSGRGSRRVAKEGSGCRFFPSFEEAKAFLIEIRQEDIENRTVGLGRAREALALAKAMQEPQA